MGAELMLTGSAISAGFFLLGWFLGGRRRPAARAGPKPVCGCTHHHSFHDPATGVCHGTKRRAKYDETTGADLGYHEIPCTCRQYSGPVPLPEFYAPEIGNA